MFVSLFALSLMTEKSLFFFSSSDVDECSKDNVCMRGQCLNTDGSFLCLCETGFKFNADMADCEGEEE